MAQIPGPPCRAAGAEFWKAGNRRVEYYQDQHGHAVELWCARGVFSAHYDLRVDRADPADRHGAAAGQSADVRHHSMTVAGCLFNYGKNIGPDIYRDASGAYSKVDWTSRDPSRREEYRFSYDFSTGMVTITLTTPCSAPVSKVVAPQESYEKLTDVLPDPPAGSCD